MLPCCSATEEWLHRGGLECEDGIVLTGGHHDVMSVTYIAIFCDSSALRMLQLVASMDDYEHMPSLVKLLEAY